MPTWALHPLHRYHPCQRSKSALDTRSASPLVLGCAGGSIALVQIRSLSCFSVGPEEHPRVFSLCTVQILPAPQLLVLRCAAWIQPTVSASTRQHMHSRLTILPVACTTFCWIVGPFRLQCAVLSCSEQPDPPRRSADGTVTPHCSMHSCCRRISRRPCSACCDRTMRAC